MTSRYIWAASLALAFGFMSGCAQQSAKPTDIGATIKSTDTKAEHLALADHYAQVAKDAEAKAAEEQKIQLEWQNHRYLDPKHAEDTAEHYNALIQHYQEIAKTNRALADLQRSIAAKM